MWNARKDNMNRTNDQIVSMKNIIYTYVLAIHDITYKVHSLTITADYDTVKPRFTYSPFYVSLIYVLFFQCIICNTYQDFDIRTSLNVLYFILRTLLNVHTSLKVLYFILRTLLYVLCQWRNKAKESVVTSVCEYWTINLCPMSSFLIIFILDQTSTSSSKVLF